VESKTGSLASSRKLGKARGVDRQTAFSARFTRDPTYLKAARRMRARVIRLQEPDKNVSRDFFVRFPLWVDAVDKADEDRGEAHFLVL
jgi:hypothetical protein